MKQEKFIQIVTTADSRKTLEKIADELIAGRLAACVQITEKVTSVYHWKGRTEKSSEYICFIKTKASLFKAVEKKIKEQHTYELPEIISIPISANPEYSGWMKKVLRR